MRGAPFSDLPPPPGTPPSTARRTWVTIAVVAVLVVLVVLGGVRLVLVDDHPATSAASDHPTPVASASGSTLPSPSPGSPAGFLTYQNRVPEFTIAYPARWTPKTPPPLTGLPPDSTQVESLVLVPPSSQFSAQVIVEIQALPSGTTLAQYTAASLAKLHISAPDAVPTSEATKLAGLPAQTIEFTSTDEAVGPEHTLVAWTVVRNTAYIVHYTARTSSYQRSLSDATAMIASFRLGTVAFPCCRPIHPQSGLQ